MEKPILQVSLQGSDCATCTKMAGLLDWDLRTCTIERGVNVLIDLRTYTFTRGVNMSAPAAGKIRDDELTGSQLAVKQFYYSVVTSWQDLWRQDYYDIY